MPAPIFLCRSYCIGLLKELEELQQYFYGTYSNQWNPILANFVISSIPIILFYILMQKNIVKGIAAGAVKG